MDKNGFPWKFLSKNFAFVLCKVGGQFWILAVFNLQSYLFSPDFLEIDSSDNLVQAKPPDRSAGGNIHPPQQVVALCCHSPLPLDAAVGLSHNWLVLHWTEFPFRRLLPGHRTYSTAADLQVKQELCSWCQKSVASSLYSHLPDQQAQTSSYGTAAGLRLFNNQDLKKAQATFLSVISDIIHTPDLCTQLLPLVTQRVPQYIPPVHN